MKLGLWHHLQNITMTAPHDSPIQPLNHTEKLCHTLGVPLIWWTAIILGHCPVAPAVFILSESHPATMLIAQLFLPQCVNCRAHTLQPVTWWVTITFIRYSMPSLIDHIFILKENKALISMSATIWSCSVVFYVWWLFILPQCICHLEHIT